jgi:hypothetical protein
MRQHRGCGDDGVGGLRQRYGRICGGPVPARDTRIVVAPMAAETPWEGRINAVQHQRRSFKFKRARSGVGRNSNNRRGASARFAPPLGTDSRSQTQTAHDPDAVVIQIKLIPGQTVAGGNRVCMVIVVPAFTACK